MHRGVIFENLVTGRKGGSTCHETVVSMKLRYLPVAAAEVYIQRPSMKIPKAKGHHNLKWQYFQNEQALCMSPPGSVGSFAL